MIKISKIFFSLLVMVLLAVEALAQERGSLEGTIRSTDGKPIPRATIIFKESPKKIVTSLNGTFLDGGMYPGKYSAFVYKIGYKTLFKDNIKIAKDSTTVLDIRLEPDPINLGYGSISGRILDQNKKPIAAAEIVIAELTIPRIDDIISTDDFIHFIDSAEKIETISDRNGNFVVPKVPPGRFTAFAMKDGYKTSMSFSIYVETQKTIKIEMRLREQKHATLYGTVRSADGEGIPGANVFLEGTKLGAATDGAGNFLIENIPPGNHTVIVEMLGFQKSQQLIRVENKKDLKLRFTLRPDIEFMSRPRLDDPNLYNRLLDLRLIYFLAESEADQNEIKRQIRELLKSMFDHKEKEYAKEIDAKKKNIEALEQLQKYRAANKNDIIERRLKELLTVY